MKAYHKTIFLSFLLFTACTPLPSSTSVPSPNVMPTDTITPTPNEFNKPQPTMTELSTNQETYPDSVYYNATIITMNHDQPKAEAIAIRGNKILAIGSNEQIKNIVSPKTKMIDLGGSTIVPGFIDSHGHWIGDAQKSGLQSIDEIIQYLLENGWTSINEMFVSPDRLDELVLLDEQDRLPVRVNAYLPVNYLDQYFGRPYLNYTPFQVLSPHVRIAGVKFFTDNDWGHIINWNQNKLNNEIQAAHEAGWQVAIHTFSTEGHSMVFEALSMALSGEDNSDHRHRIEHVISINDTQLLEIQEQGYIASIQLNFPGNIPQADPTFYEKVPKEDLKNYTRWSDIHQAGILIAAGTDWPWFSNYSFVEIGNAPAGSPLRLIYKAATHTGPEDQLPDEWMRQQYLPVDASLQALTINGAYATFEEDIKGSLAPGKLADLVVLSENPLETPIDDIVDIHVRLTMIGGSVVYCDDYSESFCHFPETPHSVAGLLEVVGNWQAEDNLDGSAMTLEITDLGDGNFGMTWYDSDAVFCTKEGFNKEKFPWMAEGSGSSTDSTLEFFGLNGKCLDHEKELTHDYFLEYDPQTDTLLDNYDVLWMRE